MKQHCMGLRKPTQDIIEAMSSTLRNAMPNSAKGYVVMQAGASEARRQWPVDSLAVVGDFLWEEHGLYPVLVGTQAEEHLAAQYQNVAKHPPISLCGKTNFVQLAATLINARLLVTNDTGTMHLAAGYGVAIIALFLATAQPFDTGPYCHGSCSLEPDMSCHPCAFGVSCPHDLACQRRITPELVKAIAHNYLLHNQWGEHVGMGARVWESRQDALGYMNLHSLSNHADEDRTKWLAVQQSCLRQFLDNSIGSVFEPAAAAPVSFSPSFTAAIHKDLVTIKGLLEVLEQQGNLLLMRPMPKVQEKFMGMWNRILVAFKQNMFLSALAVLWVEATQADGQDLPAVLLQVANFQRLVSLYISSIN